MKKIRFDEFLKSLNIKTYQQLNEVRPKSGLTEYLIGGLIASILFLLIYFGFLRKK